jgi:positive regulator of sigma E activity
MSERFVRRLRVVEVAAGRTRLEPASPACEACSACSGRCHGILSGLVATDRLALSGEDLPAGLHPGDELLLEFDPAALSRRAWSVYGLPLAGLLIGVLIGTAALDAPGAIREVAVALGALAGFAVGLLTARLIGDPATPPYRFASLPSPLDVEPPCEPRPEP